MSESKLYVIKSDGTEELFSFEKLRGSLKRSGASTELAESISSHIEKEMVSGMTTSDIYRHAFSVLHSREKTAAARYSLRRSLLALGPTGFPFEKFVGEVFKRRGYSIALDQIIQGHCVDHELDVVAWNNDRLIMAEAKFHHELAYKTDLKVVLYVKARFDDLKDGSFVFGSHKKLDEGLLITNTKFTEKAIKYSECAGVRLLGWNYPRTGNLHELIEETNLHPVTCLTSLSESHKQLLMSQGIVLCESLREDAPVIKSLGISDDVLKAAQAESTLLCPA